jgi:hypothetical protein
MPVRNDDNPLDRTDPEGIDDLLAQDRDLLARAADERIAGGMYARIAHAHAERKLAAGWKWQWQLVIASLACAVLVAVWFALPKKSVREAPPSAQVPAVTPARVQVAAQPPIKKTPARSLVPAARFHPVAAQAALPRQAIFPINVAPTEQERLLSQLAARSPQELRLVAEAMAEQKNQDERAKQEFDQWLQQRGGSQ